MMRIKRLDAMLEGIEIPPVMRVSQMFSDIREENPAGTAKTLFQDNAGGGNRKFPVGFAVRNDIAFFDVDSNTFRNFER